MDPNNENHPNYNQIPTIDSSLCPQNENNGSQYFVFLEDLVNGGGASPPTNLTYTFLNNQNFKDEEKYAIDIYCTDPSASVQGIEIYRVDLPSLIFS